MKEKTKATTLAGILILAGSINLFAQNNTQQNQQIQQPNREINSSGTYQDTSIRGSSNYNQPDGDRLNPVNQNNNQNQQYDQRNPNFQDPQTNPNSQPQKVEPSKSEQDVRTNTGTPIQRDDQAVPAPQPGVSPSNRDTRVNTGKNMNVPPNQGTTVQPGVQENRQQGTQTQQADPVKPMRADPATDQIRKTEPATRTIAPEGRTKRDTTGKMYLVPDSTLQKNNPK